MRVILMNAGVLIAVSMMAVSSVAEAEIERRQVNADTTIIEVSQDTWQPEDFVNGTPVPATWLETSDVKLDGLDDEASWSRAIEVEVPLNYGRVNRAFLKALYTDDDVFIRVRWPDVTENREHRPWVWDEHKQSFVESPNIEDSVMLSFEAGCEWAPSLLSGYVYDFDGWKWMAGRSDPLGQAVDLYGNVQDRELVGAYPEAYENRAIENDWILKFIENHDVNQTADWFELERVYFQVPIADKLWVKAVPDGGPRSPEFVERLPAPDFDPEDENFSLTAPQFSPVELTGSAGEVKAKGQWVDGYWTVEFQRKLETPVGHIYDTIFNRMVQFSVIVFDQAESLEESSESGRLFLRFLPKEKQIAKN